MARAKFRQQQSRIDTRNRMIVVGVAAALVLLVLFFMNYNLLFPPPPLPDAVLASREMGNPESKVVVEEFADYQCPWCARVVTDIQPRLIEQYIKPGRIRFIFRNFPFIDQSNPIKESHLAALAALCAGDQEKFWDYHDLLLMSQTGENVGDFTAPRLLAFAMQLQLDSVAFNACMNTEKYKSVIDLDVQRADALQVNSTPFFYINGKPVELKNSLADLFAAIDAAILQAGG